MVFGRLGACGLGLDWRFRTLGSRRTGLAADSDTEERQEDELSRLELIEHG